MIIVVRLSKVLIHLFLVYAAFVAAFEIRQFLPFHWWLTNPQAPTVLRWGALYTLIAAIVEFVFKTERSSWRYASVREVVRLALAGAITAAAFLVITFLSTRATALPRSTIILAWVFSLFALVGVRLAWRLRWNPSLAFGEFLASRKGGIPLTLVGDVGQAEAYLRIWDTAAKREYRPTGILSAERRSIGQMIHGVPVLGDVQGLVRRMTAVTAGSAPSAILFLDDPVSALHLTTADIGRLKTHGYRLLRQASAVDVLGDEEGGGLREIKLEEFLPRAPLRLDPSPVGVLVAGKRVLVTGAGGSIGSEIARQLVAFGCAHIGLVDHSEFALFEIDRELARLTGHAFTRSAILCNVREEKRIRDVLIAEQPDIVFHAAALKHVTLVEKNPCEGVLTNVIGTWNVAAAAKIAGAGHMVMISTDKAVDPTNMMGASKRLAEALLPAHAQGATRYSVVRFGNVLGSAGSVVPIFRDQIERGGPVTVTHPDVERFFMTIPEAVQLVLHATALRAADPKRDLRKFVLEMGDPVKIIDLARQMIEISGGKLGGNIAIDIVGLQPGEKLTEELLDQNERGEPCRHGITEITSVLPEKVVEGADVATLAALAERGDSESVRTLVAATLAAVRREPMSPRLSVVASTRSVEADGRRQTPHADVAAARLGEAQ